MVTLFLRYRKAYSCFDFHFRSFSAVPASNFDTPCLDSCSRFQFYGSAVLEDLLQKCARNKMVKEGKVCHGQVILVGLESDTLMSNIIINMYSKCGLVDVARRTFNRIVERSLVSWNTMIGTYARQGREEEALKLFMEMQREGTHTSEFTLSSVLCACASKSATSESKQLHAYALKIARIDDVFVGTALLDVYAKSNLIDDSRRVFDSMPERSAVTWSSMVAGYVQNMLHEEALILFHRAQKMDLEQSQFTLSAALSACAGLSSLIEGKQVHVILVKTGFSLNFFVRASLIDLYAKCGSIEEAYLVFSNMRVKNVALWNAMISGFSRHALSVEAMVLFEKMQQMGLKPNEITYVSILSVCSHKGLVETGRMYFNIMIGDYNVQPNVNHYSCMVDLLGRAGLIQDAYDFILEMPFDATASMWGSLLGSCRIYHNLELAEVAAKQLFEIEPNNAGNHVLLSNIYATNKRWEEVAWSRKLLKASGAKKEMGKSWIEAKDKVHTFIAGQGNHPMLAEIHLKLERLEQEMKKLDYKVEIENDLHCVDENVKEELLRHHSEKLALAFGLISLPANVPIRIKKNLRICGDCHSFIKLASRITNREIIVRDTNRFHHFKEGSCSCSEFW
ncbi:hypothetical protein Sjap_012441 [Stephania japonica]|uniref:DYW domain-containing protein n=1 Tax=Stephania japonica TaxID=461633 RepID=A0AAP0IW34_9MAGN